jgi:hypothetical protein
MPTVRRSPDIMSKPRAALAAPPNRRPSGASSRPRPDRATCQLTARVARPPSALHSGSPISRRGWRRALSWPKPPLMGLLCQHRDGEACAKTPDYNSVGAVYLDNEMSGPANRMNLAEYPSTCFVAKRSDIENARLLKRSRRAEAPSAPHSSSRINLGRRHQA